jgi:hypothetical protein
VYVVPAQVKGGLQGFAGNEVPRTDRSGMSLLVSRGRVELGMLLNYGCDIDKSYTSRLQFALVRPLSELPESVQEQVAAGKSFAMMYLPDAPNIGDCYVDFRYCVTVDKLTAQKCTRLASMTDAARTRLYAGLFEFYTRQDFSDYKTI